MKAHLRNARISPKKMNVVASMIRGKKVVDALNFLQFTPKKAAHLLYKVVSSAAANAQNNFQQNKTDLIIKNVVVTQGPSLKRGLPVSRGRWHPIKKRTAHVTVAVEAGEAAPKKKSAKKSVAKKEEKTKITAPTHVTPEEARKKMEEIKTEKREEKTEGKSEGKHYKQEQGESDASKTMHRREGM